MPALSTRLLKMGQIGILPGNINLMRREVDDSRFVVWWRVRRLDCRKAVVSSKLKMISYYRCRFSERERDIDVSRAERANNVWRDGKQLNLTVLMGSSSVLRVISVERNVISVI